MTDLTLLLAHDFLLPFVLEWSKLQIILLVCKFVSTKTVHVNCMITDDSWINLQIYLVAKKSLLDISANLFSPFFVERLWLLLLFASWSGPDNKNQAESEYNDLILRPRAGIGCIYKLALFLPLVFTDFWKYPLAFLFSLIATGRDIMISASPLHCANWRVCVICRFASCFLSVLFLF